MINRINAARIAHGLSPLRESVQLANAAKKHAGDLASSPWLIDTGQWHTGSDGSSVFERIRREGYVSNYVRENTGWGWGGDPDVMFNWWMNSPAHKANILDPAVNEVGTGYLYAPGSPWTHYWVHNFAKSSANDTPEPPRPYTTYVPVVVTPSNSTGLDMLAYLRGDGRAYMVQHPSGAQEKFRTVEWPAHRWGQLKNNQWEEFWYTDDYIWRGVDTSPGDGQYYRQFEANAQGARWCPRRMTVGQAWVAPVTHTVQTYDKATCRPVDHHRNGTTTNRLTLVARHERMTWGGVTVDDVIQVVSSTGETMYFGRNYGLCAWRSAWGSSAISNVLPPHEADNQPETGCFGP